MGSQAQLSGAEPAETGRGRGAAGGFPVRRPPAPVRRPGDRSDGVRRAREVQGPHNEARHHQRVSVQHRLLEDRVQAGLPVALGQTGPYEITTRWTMVMKFMPLPWKPELVFTGTSIMGINPETGKFCSHVDYWDSIKENEYFSLEGLRDVFRQLQYYKTPELQSPIYQILKRTGKYEVRKYAPFLVAETSGDKLSGSKGFNDIAGYIFGKNSKTEKMKMTTPVFTQAFDNELSKISIQFVLPLEKDLSSVPDPSQKNISLRQVDGGIAAVLKFSGEPTEDIVLEKERELRSSLLRDGLKPKMGCLFARYNDPGRTWSFTLRNEVLIWLEEFELD